MVKHMKAEKLEQELIKTIRDLNIKNAIKSMPVYTLGEMLEIGSLNDLKYLAKAYKVRGCTKMSKAGLIAAISSELTDIDRMKEMLYIIDEIQFGFFKEVASRKYIQDDLVPVRVYAIMNLLGYIQCYYYEGKIKFVMPEEVKKLFKSLGNTDFYKEKEYFDLLNNYARAATSLYGIIPEEDFVELFNSQNEMKTTFDEIFYVLIKFISLDSGYCFYEEFIVSDEYEEDDFKDVHTDYSKMKTKPRYTPPKEEFLKYADYNYFEKTPQLVDLENYINQYLSDDTEKTMEIIDDIQLLCTQEADFQEIIDALESYDIMLKDFKQVQEFVQYITDVMNNTRLWSNNGHTPRELSGKLRRTNLKLLPSEPVKSKKIGRNDPCPCGSGKKYKKCCGGE